MTLNALYTQLAQSLQHQIEQGALSPGEKLLGVRKMSEQEGVSPSTVISAYRKLEMDGFLTARDRSGYYVSAQTRALLPEPSTSQPTLKPVAVTGQDLVLQLLSAAQNEQIVSLGAAIPEVALLPQQALESALNSVIREKSLRSHHYELPGLPQLRGEVAKRLAKTGARVNPEHIVITSGAQEAMYLSLKMLTQPGDIIALESPTYYGVLQAAESLGLKVLEIPTHPHDGISLDALRLAFEQWSVKACILVPNFSNPLGSYLADQRKHDLVVLAQEFNVTLIEDDIYGDMSFDHQRPRTLLSHAQDIGCPAQVIHCASVSKTVSPTLRVGWVISTEHTAALSYEKFITNCTAPALSQLALAKLFQNGKYQRHLRGMQSQLANSARKITDAIALYFPKETRVTQPKGGCVLWLELPKTINAIALTHQALDANISIAPGPIFSTTRKYTHCIRLSFGVVWGPHIEQALRKLGQLVHLQLTQ